MYGNNQICFRIKYNTSTVWYSLQYTIFLAIHWVALLWHQNGCGGVSNQQPHDCLLKHLFRRRSKKTSKLRVTGLFWGPVNSPHKWPVTRKIFPFDGVIMERQTFHEEVMTWKRVSHCWSFVKGINRSPVDFLHKRASNDTSYITLNDVMT